MRIIAGEFGGRILKTVSGPGYRPAMCKVRESLFSMLESRGIVWDGCRVLDLFAGSGSLSFEALSRGAAEAVMVEMAPQAVSCLKQNAASLSLDSYRCRVLACDVLAMLKKNSPVPYNIVFIDPPYRKNLLMPALNLLSRKGWIGAGSVVCVEIEQSLKLDAETALEDSVLLADRAFGQTRIILWKKAASA